MNERGVTGCRAEKPVHREAAAERESMLMKAGEAAA